MNSYLKSKYIDLLQNDKFYKSYLLLITVLQNLVLFRMEASECNCLKFSYFFIKLIRRIIDVDNICMIDDLNWGARGDAPWLKKNTK